MTPEQFLIEAKGKLEGVSPKWSTSQDKWVDSELRDGVSATILSAGISPLSAAENRSNVEFAAYSRQALPRALEIIERQGKALDLAVGALNCMGGGTDYDPAALVGKEVSDVLAEIKTILGEK